MIQNTIFGDLSDFLKGLGSRLTDVDRMEAMTLAPLVVLTVVLGLFPALVLDLVRVAGRRRSSASSRHRPGRR